LKQTYCDILAKYKSDLERPFDEATSFLNDIEVQLNTLCNGASRICVYGLSLSLFVPRLYIYIYIYMIFIFIFLYFVEFCAVGFIFPIMLRPSSLPMFFQRDLHGHTLARLAVDGQMTHMSNSKRWA
jgi:hypothetical protein